MKVINENDLIGTERDVKFKEGTSIRMILEKDEMGFSFHKTIIPKGKKGHWHYKYHKESCYCIQGKGILTNLTTKEQHKINVGDIYILDNHDNHTFESLEDVVLISVFNPPIKGNEIHQKDGSYKN
tara:strand:+ start:1320 stop:1697 length:378 start_codon:yes stop_codon:yes gene_type:complete